MNADSLLSKASSGSVTKRELEDVVHRLSQRGEDSYDLLLILGRAGAAQYRRLVDGFLEAPDDPMLARLAVQVLCRYWGLADEYKDVLERFARGVPWDSADDVRLMAIDCLGALLAKQMDARLLAYLYETYENDAEDKLVRETAYSALAESVGGRLPPASRHFDLQRDVEPQVLERVRALIAAR